MASFEKSNIELLISENGNAILWDHGYGDTLGFYAVVTPESAAGLLLALGKRAYIYAHANVKYNMRTITANDLAYEIMCELNKHYVNRKGRRPDVGIDIIDPIDGSLVTAHTIIGVKH